MPAATFSSASGTWSADGSELTATGDAPAIGWLATRTDKTQNGTVTAAVTPQENGSAGLVVRYMGTNNFTVVRVNHATQALEIVERWNSLAWTTRASTPLAVTAGAAHSLRVTLDGLTLTAQSGAASCGFDGATLSQAYGTLGAYVGAVAGGAVSDIAVSNRRPFAVAEACQITTLASALALRQLLIDRVWSGDGMPTAGVDSTATDVDSPISDVPNLLRVDQLTIDSDNGFVSTPYVWYPAADANGRLALVSQGHALEFDIAGVGDLIRALVEAGYTVAGFYLPGDASVDIHNAYPQPNGVNYLRYWCDPPARLLNELGAGFDHVCMSGLSGGGWLTYFYSAIDPRITRAVPVAGGLPVWKPVASRDWEQFLPGIRGDVCDLDMYALGADQGRVEVVILNAHDIFGTQWYDVSADYAPYLTALASNALAGSWSLEWDTTHWEHKISEWAIARILSVFGA